MGPSSPDAMQTGNFVFHLIVFKFPKGENSLDRFNNIVFKNLDTLFSKIV